MGYAGFVLANLRRSPLRTAFTSLAILLAVALVTLLMTMPAGLDALIASATSNTRISVVNEAGVVYPMPYAFTRKVRAVPGVSAAVAMTWFGGAFEEAGQVTFPNFAVEVDQVGAVYPDYAIDPRHLADFRRFRDGAIVGRQTMAKYGWKVGDRITLRSTVWPADLDLRIVGEIPDERSPLLWLNREYADQAIRARGYAGLGVASVIWVRTDEPQRVNAIMRAIDDLSRNSEAETASETEASFFANFFGSLQGFATVILVVTGLVALCIVFIAANTASMAVRERAGEIAVLKALGFGRGLLFATLLAEVVLLSTLAGGGGVAIAVLLTESLRQFAALSPALGPLGSFIVTGPIVAAGLGLSVLVGLVAGFAPAWGAARKPVVEALREVF